MKSLPQKCAYSAILLLVVCAVYPLKSIAQDGQALIKTNGYICAPKNPGGEETRLYFRQQDGVAINLSQNDTFPVVCPVLATYDIYNVRGTLNGLIVRLGNGGNATQTFACALEEYDIGFNKVRSIGQSISLPPRTTNTIQYLDFNLLSDGNAVSLRCILPPRGELGQIVSY